MALVGFGAGRALSDRGYRALYGVALRKGRSGLEDLLNAISLHSRTGGAFAPSAVPALETKTGPEA